MVKGNLIATDNIVTDQGHCGYIYSDKARAIWSSYGNILTDNIDIKHFFFQNNSKEYLSQLMRLWYLSHRRPTKAQLSLRIRAVSPEPSLVAHMKYGSRRRVRPKLRHLASLDGCACVFEEWILRVRSTGTIKEPTTPLAARGSGEN